MSDPRGPRPAGGAPAPTPDESWLSDRLSLLARLERDLAAREGEICRLKAEVAHGAPLRPELVPGARSPWSVKGLLKTLAGVRLQLEPYHAPRPLRIPSRYERVQPLAAPPTISIVTPSFNQARFVAETLRSVIDQRYSRLEYVVQDGGSRDGSLEILERARPYLHHLDSRPDRGQANAINLGFAHTTGEVMAYLNSDDLLLPGALHYVARYFCQHPEVDVLYGHRILVDEEGAEIGRWILPPHRGDHLLYADYVPQETLFWRRRIWEQVGGRVDESFQFAVDWELLLRFVEAGAKIVRVPRFLGAFRVHQAQKTALQLAGIGALEMDRLRHRFHGRGLSLKEVRRGLLGFMLAHGLCRRLYQVGLLRY